MKKFFALLLALVMALSLVACGNKEPKTDDNANTVTYPEYFTGMDELIAAAQAEGELVVYGSCEEEYLAAACATLPGSSSSAAGTGGPRCWPGIPGMGRSDVRRS